MALQLKGKTYDTMKEACARLGISRGTLLTYFKEGILSDPPTVQKGRTHFRYFPEEWYQENEPKMKEL